MATPSKTIQTALLSVQSLASNTVVISSVVDVSTAFGAAVHIHFGRRAQTALTEGVDIRIEASSKSSGDGHWFPIAAFKTRKAAVTSQAVSGTCSAGQNVIAMASTTGMSLGDYVYIDNGTIANSEWGKVKVVTTNTSITIEDNLVNAQTGATVYPSGELFTAYLDLTPVKRIRLVVNGANTGQAVAVEAELVTFDSVS